MSEEEIPEARKQLLALRAVTQNTGALHEGQVVQLKYWPRIAIPHSTACEIAYFQKERNEAGVVTRHPVIEFRMTLGKSKPPKNLKSRLAGLSRSVKDLLGPDFGVRVKVGAKVIYQSKGKKLVYAQSENNE